MPLCTCASCFKLRCRLAKDLATAYIKKWYGAWRSDVGKPRLHFDGPCAFFGPCERQHWQPFNDKASPRTNAIAWVAHARRWCTPYSSAAALPPNTSPRDWTPDHHAFLCMDRFKGRVRALVTCMAALDIGFAAVEVTRRVVVLAGVARAPQEGHQTTTPEDSEDEEDPSEVYYSSSG